ncbi:hypothetical protein [Bacillus sp. 196mf]|uniref:hypothetical protein n=1 Tax=Bacillus sp. 196mf TaxID=1761754 RepID=UPI0011570107|nr:hypothetical protein [Bacillus sp. 196mf]
MAFTKVTEQLECISLDTCLRIGYYKELTVVSVGTYSLMSDTLSSSLYFQFQIDSTDAASPPYSVHVTNNTVNNSVVICLKGSFK